MVSRTHYDLAVVNEYRRADRIPLCGGGHNLMDNQIVLTPVF